MKKVTIHEFHPSIYPRRIWVVKGCNKKIIKDKFSERDGEEIVLKNEEGYESACTVFPYVKLKENGKYGYLVCIQSRLSAGDVAHESVHVATEIFREIGAIHTPDNQEPFAYLVGWIADCIQQVITGKFNESNQENTVSGQDNKGVGASESGNNRGKDNA